MDNVETALFFLILPCAALLALAAAAYWRIASLRKDLKMCAEEKANLEAALKEEAFKRETVEKFSASLEGRISENDKKIEALLNENIRLEKSEARMQERERAMLEKAGEFEAFSAKIFESARQKFESSNKIQLDSVLSPLKENLASFRKRIDDVAEHDAKKYGSLERQINMLSEMNAKISKEADNLAKALVSNNKTAGNWGEMILEDALKNCGLVENVNFLTQDSHTQDGKSRILDVLVRLPGNRNFIIDSKVSLVNYMNYCAAADEKSREAELKLFLASVRSHIKSLSAKNYESLKDVQTPDFVLIFIPIEGAFELAITRDLNLLEYANSLKIALASPATLLACLRTVENIWSIEKQNKNTLEIAELGKSLHERICIFLERFAELGKSIEKVQKGYADLDTSVSGRQGVLGTALRLSELGVKSKKNIGKKYLEDGADE
ncbi:MAG: DNA recombination protein RmuC [Opitutales bacterium]|nr:DNA recombination protein RmuC [Opitutales bacterium]